MRYTIITILIALAACTSVATDVEGTTYTEAAITGNVSVVAGEWVSDTTVAGVVVLGDSLADLTVKSLDGISLHLGTQVEAGTADMLVEVDNGKFLILPMVRVPCVVDSSLTHFNATCSAATEYGIVSVRIATAW